MTDGRALRWRDDGAPLALVYDLDDNVVLWTCAGCKQDKPEPAFETRDAGELHRLCVVCRRRAMMRQKTDAERASVGCVDVCGVGPGEQCLSPKGRRLPWNRMHSARRQACEEADDGSGVSLDYRMRL
jgi:hypothetical protein